MSKCTCGAQLLQTSLTCPECGRKYRLDQGQAGNLDAASRVDWDAEFQKLSSGQLRDAKIEVVPQRLSILTRIKRMFGIGN